MSVRDQRPTWRRDDRMSVPPSEADIVSETSLFVKCHQMTIRIASHLIANTKKQIRAFADRFQERHTSPTACTPITKEEAMKVTTITRAMVLALSSSLAFASGTHANGAAHGAPSSHRMSNRLAPGVTTPGSTTSMGRAAESGMYRDNDANVYRDGLPRNDVNPHGG
jgi:hypothetical protein